MTMRGGITTREISSKIVSRIVSVLLSLACIGAIDAQMIAQDVTPAQTQNSADAHKLPTEKGEVLDRVVAIVNGDLVLESDIDEEIRFERIQPYRVPPSGETERDRALNRLIDRRLILQQQRGLAVTPISDAALDAGIKDLRNDMAVCAGGACKTDEQWKHMLAGRGFTPEELRERWRIRMQVLAFIEQRFRSGIRISDAEISKFYTEYMLPEYKRRDATAPPLESVSDRIEEILLQQKVSELLNEWLKSLREQGSVRILKQGEEAP